MAFNSLYFAAAENQSKHGVTPSKYVYRTTDSLATVLGYNYFSSINQMLLLGDVIEVDFVDSLTAQTQSLGKAVVQISMKTTTGIKAFEGGANKRLVTCTLADVSTASNQTVTSSVAGVITKIYSVLGNAITVADAALTYAIGAVNITGGTATVAFNGSAAGDVDTATPTGLRTVAVGDVLKVTTDGASTTASPLYVVFEISEDPAQSEDVVHLTTRMTDVSTDGAGSADGVAWVVSPIAGTITKIRGVLGTAITVADAAVPASIAGVDVTNGSLAIVQAGSAAGSVFTATPTAARTVTAGQAIKFTSDGGSTTASTLDIMVEITAN